MKEEKVMSFTQPGYRLQLLKITETTVNGYYQIRENRRIKATFTTLDAAIKKFYALLGSKILQKNIFTYERSIQTGEQQKRTTDGTNNVISFASANGICGRVNTRYI